MQVRINGKIENITETRLLDLLKLKNIEPQMVSVELNSKMLDRDSLSSILLQEGDQLEFLYFMGGGCRGWHGHSESTAPAVGVPTVGRRKNKDTFNVTGRAIDELLFF